MAEVIRIFLQRSSLNFVQKCNFKTTATRFVNMVAPSNFQKKILVWTKFYSSTKEVPAQISQVQMKKAHDMFRVKASIFMLVFTFGALGASMVSGNYLRKSGDSISQRGLDQIEAWKKT